jgi:hypothetical protein
MLLIKYLCVTWCGSEPLYCSYVLLWIDTVVFYFYSNYLEDYQQFIENNHYPDEMMNRDFPDGNWFRAYTPLDYKSGSCITLWCE